MNALTFALLSGLCASISNFFFHKSSSDTGPKFNINTYVVFYYLVSFLLSLVICHQIWKVPPKAIVVVLGSIVGIFNVLLMVLISRALRCGPAGLTFTFQNVSSIFPGAILFAIFGSDFGFSFSYLQLIGIVMVLIGLCIGTKNDAENPLSSPRKWLKYALGCFCVQIIALTIMQARSILFDSDTLYNFPSALSITKVEDVWFMPAQFASSLVFQLVICALHKTKPHPSEMIYGSMAGVTNAASTFCILLATQWAFPAEKVILFPCFAVSTIVLCNMWANWIYKEKFNLLANTTCGIGIVLGSPLF